MFPHINFQPSNIALNVTVVEARGLKPADRNGKFQTVLYRPERGFWRRSMIRETRDRGKEGKGKKVGEVLF